MRIPSTPAALPTPNAAPAASRAPASPEAAAIEFEQVLAKQFASTMTASLFQDSLEGEGGPGWMGGYRDSQRDVLTDALAGHLVDSGSLRIRDLLLRQWGRAGATPAEAPLDTPLDAPLDMPSAPGRPAPADSDRLA